ncbi:MAG: secretin N-terminal domain-containing protein [Aliarcobacter sp.]
MRSGVVLILALLFSLSAVGVRGWAQERLSVPGRAALPATGEAPAVQEPEMVSAEMIQFPNNPVSDFLGVYEKLKGVTLIKDASLLGGGANLSLTLDQPVTKAEAIRLIESTLLLNGYAFIAMDKNSVKVINTAGGKNPRSEGVFLFTNESELPEGEVVASYVMPLTHLAAADAVPIFEQFITLHPYGSLVPVPVANQVLITENSTLIRRLIQVRDLIDTPAPERKTDFIQLVQANADRVVELITQILEKREEKSGGTTAKAATGQVAQPGVPGLPGGAGGSAGVTISGSKSGFAGDIQLIADTRTNRILVIASPFDFAGISSLIKQFDIAVDLSVPYEQSLNYVAATDMLPILADMLAEEGDDASAGGAGGSKSTGAVSGGIGAGRPVTGASGGSSTSSSGKTADVLSEPGEEQAAQSLVVGKTKLIADNRANSILVIGQPEARDKVKAILSKLDKKPMQVYLATVIGQLLVSNDDEFAVNILQKYIGGPRTGAASVAGGKPFISGTTTVYGTDVNGNPTAQTQSGVTPVSPAAATLSQMSQVAVGALPGMQIATFILGSIDLYINALTATAKFRIASRPSVFTANNKKATIFNGKKIAVPTSTVTTLGAGGSANTTSGSQQSNIQYQDVVLKIEVVPLINSAREISLQIVQTNDTISQNSTNIGGGVTVPEINTQELNTTVIVPDRSTILLGGLVTQQDTKNVAGVPFVSTIPLLGNLFKSTSDTTQRQELVVMIQPSVVVDGAELKEISKTERDLTGFSSKELSPLSMRSGQKSGPMSLNPPVAEPISATEAKQE